MGNHRIIIGNVVAGLPSVADRDIIIRWFQGCPQWPTVTASTTSARKATASYHINYNIAPLLQNGANHRVPTIVILDVFASQHPSALRCGVQTTPRIHTNDKSLACAGFHSRVSFKACFAPTWGSGLLVGAYEKDVRFWAEQVGLNPNGHGLVDAPPV